MTAEERSAKARAAYCGRKACAVACSDPDGCDVHCHADRDGACDWTHCPQIKDNEPRASGRHCPRDLHDDQPDY